MNLQIFSLRERPDLIAAVFAEELQAAVWPEFMRHDAAAALYYDRLISDDYLDCAFAALIEGEVVGRAFSVPFAFNVEGRTELPDGDWDEVIRWAHADRRMGGAPTTMSALEIALVPKARDKGHSLAMLDALKASARKMGLAELFAPVRPNQKHLRPRIPMRDYVNLVHADGLPTDAWLRTHVRIGARIVKVAACSMTVVGTLSEWSRWTGMAFERSGEVEVEGALVPVLVSVEQNYGVYVEPNVWLGHRL
jgi:GNAT superfamily N-acetyltransferase